MLKNKIKEIIYSSELTEEEKELFCDYYKGDKYDYGTYGAGWEFINDYKEQECYDARICKLANNIITNGAIDTLKIYLCEDSNRLNMAIIRFLKTLTENSFTLKELDNILNS